MRTPIIAGNWKMHNTVAASLELAEALKPLVANAKAQVVVCPVFTSLAAVKKALEGSNIAVGAQNMHWEEKGAFTGEIAPAMLKDAGCEYVILGHSERRQYFAETDDTVNKKMHAAFNHGLTPIFCVGELLEEREAGTTEAVLERQVKEGMKGLNADQAAATVIAYEPVWAIGTGRTASAEDANAGCAYIRSVVKEVFGAAAADAVRIQYGGSVKAANAVELMGKSDIDGALVGGAALQADSFSGIVNF